jgi:hypothetical protein
MNTSRISTKCRNKIKKHETESEMHFFWKAQRSKGGGAGHISAKPGRAHLSTDIRAQQRSSSAKMGQRGLLAVLNMNQTPPTITQKAPK